MTLRDADSDHLSIKVTRTVPLWGLLTGLIAVIMGAAAISYGQIRQSDLIAGQSATIEKQGLQTNAAIRELSSSVSQLSIDLGKANLKAVEYEFRIGDLDRRLRTLEQKERK